MTDFLKKEDGDYVRLEPGVYDVPLQTEDGQDLLAQDGQTLVAPGVGDYLLLEDGTELLNEDGNPVLMEQGGKIILEAIVYVLNADPGTYAITGSDATLTTGIPLSAAPTLTVQQGGANVRPSSLPVITISQGAANVRLSAAPVLALIQNSGGNFPALTVTY